MSEEETKIKKLPVTVLSGFLGAGKVRKKDNKKQGRGKNNKLKKKNNKKSEM